MRNMFYLAVVACGLLASTGCQDTWDSITRCEQRKNEFLFGPFMNPPVYSAMWDNAPTAPPAYPAYGPAYAPAYAAPACGCQSAGVVQQQMTMPTQIVPTQVVPTQTVPAQTFPQQQTFPSQ